MVYRTALLGIACFWLVMMTLLIRLETHPEATDILDVPVSYVGKIMFKHGQVSTLTVLEQEKLIGTLSLHPAVTGSGGRSLMFSGALSLPMPMAATRQRFTFNGAADMDAAMKMRDFHVEITLLPTRGRLSLEGDVARMTLNYEVHQGGQLINSGTLPMASGQLLPALMQDAGIDARALPVTPGEVAPPAVTAREARITLHGEQLDVYRVTAAEGTTLTADIYVTELGQIVLANTSFGYTLTADDYTQ